MYSVVVLMALTTGVDTPDFGRKGGCHGGRGGRHHSCCGCGGGYGGGCGGGGCGGGYGGGCGGGYGGGCGGGVIIGEGCVGGYGGCQGGTIMPPVNEMGGMGASGMGAGGMGGNEATGLPAKRTADDKAKFDELMAWYKGDYKGEDKQAKIDETPGFYNNLDKVSNKEWRDFYTDEIKKKPKKEESRVPAPATIIVSLPADARLTVDGYQTTSTSSERIFLSPNLTPGYQYHYTLKAEFVRDNQPVTISKVVSVRAGSQSRIQINDTVAVSVTRR